MQHLAIDLGGRESQVCVRDSSGAILSERRVPTRRLGELLTAEPPSRVIVETCSEAFGIAELATSAGHEARVVPATLAPSLGVGARGLKNDVRDARALSEASCRMELPSVHVPSRESREKKSMCAARETLVKMRTSAVNAVRGYMRTQLMARVQASTSTFARKARQAFVAAPDGVPVFLERLLATIEAIDAQIAAADKELAAVAKAEPICRQLMSVPGVGPVTALRFTAAIDRADRFKSPSDVSSYLGLTPGEKTTGFKTHRTSITRAGASKVRWALIQAAWTLMRVRPLDPAVQWATQVAARRGRGKAAVALARKLAGILFAIWRDGTSYNPSLGARGKEGKETTAAP